MATELGVAYLSLSASTKDFAKDVKAALKDVEVDAESTGKKSGSALGAGMKKGLVAIGAGVAGVTALVAGLAIKGGISRALAIEDAQAKLKGLGHTTESVQAIMDSALASVKGTAFGLGDAATVAASTVAAGVKPGADLTRTLKLVADASTIAGTSMGDMGLIFNKVASTGKIQGEVIAQLGERGIPILQLLGEQLGISAAEVSKLASEGKVDFATFQAAMEAGMGGAALASGETFRGALANTMAALGRLGEKVISGVLPQIRDGFGSAIDTLDGFAPHAERLGQVIGDVLSRVVAAVRSVAPALVVVGSAIASTVGWMNKNRGVVIALAAVIGALVLVTEAHAAAMAVAAAGGIAGYIKSLQLVQAVTKVAAAVQWAWNAALTANPIGLIIVAIAALVAGIVYFFTQTETGKKAWDVVWSGIQAAVQWAVDHIGPILAGLWDYLQTMWRWSPLGMIVNNWSAITSAFSTGVDRVKAFLNGAWDVIKTVWGYSPLGLIVNNWSAIMEFFQGIPGRIRSLFSGAGDWLTDAGRKIIDGLVDGIKGAFKKVKDTLGGLTDMLPEWKGPEQRDKKLLVKPGQVVMGGFVKGLESSYGDVRRTLMGLTADLPSQVSVNANPERASGNAMPMTIQQTINPAPGMSEEAIGTAAARTLSFEMAGVVLP